MITSQTNITDDMRDQLFCSLRTKTCHELIGSIITSQININHQTDDQFFCSFEIKDCQYTTAHQSLHHKRTSLMINTTISFADLNLKLTSISYHLSTHHKRISFKKRMITFSGDFKTNRGTVSAQQSSHHKGRLLTGGIQLNTFRFYI